MPITPYTTSPVGGHVWEQAGIWAQHPENHGLLTVPVPSMLYDSGYSWADLATCSRFYGPASHMLDLYAPRARNLAGQVEAMAYVPEHPKTAPNMPPDEAADLEKFLPETQDLATTAGARYVYGPGSRLYAEPEDWAYGKSWTWQTERIQALAAMLDPGSVFIIRPHTIEARYPNDLDAYAAAVAELANLWLAANPTLSIVVHISLQVGEPAAHLWLKRREALIAEIGKNLTGTYAGMKPEAQAPGSGDTLAYLLHTVEAAG